MELPASGIEFVVDRHLQLIRLVISTPPPGPAGHAIGLEQDLTCVGSHSRAVRQMGRTEMGDLGPGWVSIGLRTLFVFANTFTTCIDVRKTCKQLTDSTTPQSSQESSRSPHWCPDGQAQSCHTQMHSFLTCYGSFEAQMEDLKIEFPTPLCCPSRREQLHLPEDRPKIEGYVL